MRDADCANLFLPPVQGLLSALRTPAVVRRCVASVASDRAAEPKWRCNAVPVCSERTGEPVDENGIVTCLGTELGCLVRKLDP